MKSEKLVDVIRGLYETEGRPGEIEPMDIALTVYLVLKGALANPVRGSGSTLGTALNVSEPTIEASVKRLTAAEWVQKHSGKSRREANSFTVILEKLPVAQDIKRTVITAEAWLLAEQYVKAVPNNIKGRPRRFSKSERQRFAFALQTFLDRNTDGDVNLLRDVINFAMRHPKYGLKARRGPHELRRPFRKILAEYRQNGSKPVTAEPASAPIETAMNPASPARTFFSLQGRSTRSAEEFRRWMSDSAAFMERDNCLLVVGDRSYEVNVLRVGGKWALLDVATGTGIPWEKAA